MIADDVVGFFDDHQRQRAPAAALDEAFDITFAQDRYSFSIWFAKPQEHSAERFGLNQEVLVLYSQYPQTDARALTAIERVFADQAFRNRLDRVLVILVHNGDEQATADLVRTNADRVIVPIVADGLRNPERGDVYVRSLIAKRFGSTDLFGMSSPITSDRYFFGRDPLVHELAARSLNHGQNSGVFGLRKTGKTSVLFALRRQVASNRVRVGYIDCQSPGTHASRWWQVLDEIASRLLVRNRSDLYSPENASTLFAEEIRGLVGGQVDKAIVMLDEVEYITHGISGALGTHWDEDFLPLWQTIRATHQETEGRLTFIVAGVNPASVERPHFGSIPNPIFQLAVPQYLEPLDEDSVRRMVRTIGRYSGLSFDEDTYGHLQRRYGGHPYLIRIACSEAWKAADTTDPRQRQRLTTATFERLSRTLKGRLAQPIKDILLSLVWWYPEEYDLLQILAEGDAPFVAEYLATKSDSLIQFARYGVLNEETSEFAIEDVRDFLKENGESYKRELSPFRRGDMPPELLPEIPDLATLSDLFDKRSQVESLLRRAVVLYLGVKYNWDNHKISAALADSLKPRSDRRDPTEIFLGRAPQEAVCELYTSDLRAVILANWEVFGSLFDQNRRRFEMNMDTMNLARRVDAHTKAVSQADVANFKNSYGWLLAHLSKMPA